jgi:alkylation response protein AidB-like acyl-CoA dehydrogenase
MGGVRTNEVFYDDVRVPKNNLIGKKNHGWYQWGTGCPPTYSTGMTGGISSFLETMVSYAKETRYNGEALAKDPLVRQKLAQLAVGVEIGRLWGHRIAWMLDKEIVPVYESSMSKLMLDDVKQHGANLGMQILGLYGQLQPGSEEAPLGGAIANFYQLSTTVRVTVGSREILRNIVALRALGLPYNQASATPYYDMRTGAGTEGASTWTTA